MTRIGYILSNNDRFLIRPDKTYRDSLPRGIPLELDTGADGPFLPPFGQNHPGLGSKRQQKNTGEEQLEDPFHRNIPFKWPESAQSLTNTPSGQYDTINLPHYVIPVTVKRCYQ